MSYKIDGNKYVARNGDVLYENKGVIIRQNKETGASTIITKQEMQRLGIDRPADHPDVHIPVNEFIKRFGGK